MSLRKIAILTKDDPATLKQALALVNDVFWEFEAEEYSKEGVSEFMDYIEYDAIAERMQDDGLVLLGCYEDGELAGVLALRSPSHISLLFVKKDHHQKGIARDLFANAVRCAQHLSGSATPLLTVHSSPYAVPIYEKLGFTPTGGETVENGIRYTPMQYQVGQSERKKKS